MSLNMGKNSQGPIETFHPSHGKPITTKEDDKAAKDANINRENADADTEYPPFRTVILIMSALYICTFLVALVNLSFSLSR